MPDETHADVAGLELGVVFGRNSSQPWLDLGPQSSGTTELWLAHQFMKMCFMSA